MRKLLSALALTIVAHRAAAQMPPSISKPIDAARKVAADANARSAAANQGAKVAPVPNAKPQPPQSAATAPRPKAPAPAGKAVASAKDSSRVTFEREVFAYMSSGRRDPFASPIETGEIRPLIADLRVVGIIFDATGRNSVVVMRDMSTQQQYRARVGQVLGRAKVSQIKPQEVVMTIEEYGFSRQETLKLNVQQTQQTKGKP